MSTPIIALRGQRTALAVRVRRIGFVGVKTDRFDEMATFAENVLGLARGHRTDGWAVFQLESGERDLFEVYRPGGYDERLLPATAAGVTIAFAVDDLLAARTELVEAGIEIVADAVWAAEAFGDPGLEGYGWLFFRAPDGEVYAMQQDHAPAGPTERGET